jgi:hypothetical protein
MNDSENSTNSESDFEFLPWDLTRLFAPRFGPGGVPGASASRAVDAPVGIIDLTAQADKSARRGRRDPKSVHALVLHQMACCSQRKDPLRSYLRLKAHFGILPDGRILQMHPIDQLVWASNGFNANSVAVEFAGNFPDTRGQYWKGNEMGKNRLTAEQVSAGRRLIQHLVKTIGLRQVLTHRQSSGTRENDPGPDIWYHVGQWAIDTLGLQDGGAGFKLAGGNSIPEVWRTWGKGRPAPAAFGTAGVSKELEEELGGELEEEVVFGPLDATLTWLKRDDGSELYTREQVRALGKKGGGGVYIARCVRSEDQGDIDACDRLIRAYNKKLTASLTTKQQIAAKVYALPETVRKRKFGIIKVGMADNFARRAADEEHRAMDTAFPNTLRYHLARVEGSHGQHGVAGVVRMVEFALARLARRANHLDGPSLPRVPSPTLGDVKIKKVLPLELLSLVGQSRRPDAAATERAMRRDPEHPWTLPPNTNWEAERSIWA